MLTPEERILNHGGHAKLKYENAIKILVCQHYRIYFVVWSNPLYRIYVPD